MSQVETRAEVRWPASGRSARGGRAGPGPRNCRPWKGNNKPSYAEWAPEQIIAARTQTEAEASGGARSRVQAGLGSEAKAGITTGLRKDTRAVWSGLDQRNQILV